MRPPPILAIVIVAVSLITGCSTVSQGRKGLACSNRHAADCRPSSDMSRELETPPKHLTDTGGYAEAVAEAAEVKASVARAASAEAGIDKARAAFLPVASFDAASGLQSSYRRPRAGDERDNPYSYALTVKLPLYQGGRDLAALDAALADHRAAKDRTRDVVLSTAYDLALSSVEVRRQTAALAILNRHEQRLRRLAQDVGAERQMGTATRVDTGDVGRQLAGLAVQKQQVKLQLASARTTLTRLRVTVNAKDKSFDRIGHDLPRDEVQLVALALSNNPRLSERLSRMEGAKARLAQAKAAYNPDLSLALSAGGEGNSSPGLQKYGELKAEVKLSVPLYSGGAKEAVIRSQREEYLATALDRDASLAGVRAAIRTALERLGYAEQMLALANTERSSAKALLSGIQTERKIGERSVFDEIRAIGDLVASEINNNTAIYEVMSAKLTLAAETGVLGDAVGLPNTDQEYALAE